MLRVGPEPGHIDKELPPRAAARLAEARYVGAQSGANAKFEAPAGAGRQLFFLPMRITFNRIDHVQVCIPPGEEGRAREFYGGLLGLEEIEKPEVLRPNGGMWYKLADAQLHAGVEPVVAPSKRHPGFEVEAAEAVRAYLERNGVRTKDEAALPGVVYRFSFFDPFGNRVELLELEKGTA